MVSPSNLRQGRYTPLRGDFWNKVLGGRISARNPFNDDSNTIELPIAPDKLQKSHHSQVDQPEPRWSLGKLSSWIGSRCSDAEDLAIWSMHQCISCLPIPNISIDQHGLFPIFEHDIFGVEGVSGLSQWILDSGATSSCTNDLSLFTSLSDNVPFSKIRVANGKYAKVAGIGDIVLKIRNSSANKLVVLHLKNVLYIPEVPVNLISTRALWNDSQIETRFTDVCKLVFADGRTVSFDNGKHGHYYCIAEADGNKYDEPPSVPRNFVCNICDDNGDENGEHALAISADVVHARLGHCGPARAEQALRQSIGLPQVPEYRKHIAEHCEGCRIGGARRKPYHGIPSQHQPKCFGDRIHSDLCGPFPVSVTGKFEYILSFVDAATGYSEIFFLQSTPVAY